MLHDIVTSRCGVYHRSGVGTNVRNFFNALESADLVCFTIIMKLKKGKAVSLLN